MEITLSVNCDALVKMLDQFPQLAKKGVGKAMAKEGKQMQSAIRSHVKSRMSVLRQGFLKNFRVALREKGNDLPYLKIFSKGRWPGVHEYGATIGGKMLIPINGRVGRKRFKAYVDELMRSGNAFFVRKGGKVILMAENIKENAKPLAGFKRRYRKAEGIKRLKRGTEIPIAILVSRVTLQKRLDVAWVVEGRLPNLKAAIQREIAEVMRK